MNNELPTGLLLNRVSLLSIFMAHGTLLIVFKLPLEIIEYDYFIITLNGQHQLLIVIEKWCSYLWNVRPGMNMRNRNNWFNTTNTIEIPCLFNVVVTIFLYFSCSKTRFPNGLHDSKLSLSILFACWWNSSFFPSNSVYKLSSRVNSNRSFFRNGKMSFAIGWSVRN